jgi:hypothetical protein
MLRLQYVSRRQESCRLFFIDTGDIRQFLVSLYSLCSDAKSLPSRTGAGCLHSPRNFAEARGAPCSPVLQLLADRFRLKNNRLFQLTAEITAAVESKLLPRIKTFRRPSQALSGVFLSKSL